MTANAHKKFPYVERETAEALLREYGFRDALDVMIAAQPFLPAKPEANQETQES